MAGLPDVSISIADGGLGLLAPTGTGVHAKVGASSAGAVGQVIAMTDPAKAAELFGTGPLVNALMDSFAAGSRLIYAVRAQGDVAGTISAVTAAKTGTGNMTVSGSPLDAYDVIVEIVDPGQRNVATFKYSLDGGDTWSQKVTVPANGSYAVPGTGLALAFTEDATNPPNSFKSGDRYTFTTTAPSASVSSINAAVGVLLNSGLDYEFIHVVGPSDASVWAALDSHAATAEQNYRYIHFLAEARGPSTGETVDQWVNALVTAAGGFSSKRVSVCAGRAEISDLLTGRLVDRNAAGLYAGRLCALGVHQSPGRVDVGALPSVVRLNPAGLNDGHIKSLDDARYITVRRYVGLAGHYITNGRIMAEATSDFRYVEARRTMDKACQLVRTAALRFEHAEATAEGLDALEAQLTAPLEYMIGAGEIAAGQVLIPRDQNIVGTSTLRARVRIQPVGIMRWIEIALGFANPVKAA